MSIIVFRDGIMAADQSVWESENFSGHRCKIRKSNDGALVGGTGSLGLASAWIQYFLHNRNGPCEPKLSDGSASASIIVVMPNGVVYEMTSAGRVEYAAPYYVLGSGGTVALGALHAGATAEQAVAAACAVNAYCREPIDVLRLGLEDEA